MTATRFKLVFNLDVFSDGTFHPFDDFGFDLRRCSAWQRSQRHGELQHLRSLKRTYQRSGQKKRRVLKLGQDADDADDDGGDDDDDDRDGDQARFPPLFLSFFMTCLPFCPALEDGNWVCFLLV